ncbi:DUF1853 family protein [Pleionea sediminis]|uniref:DUF1853 family protein n=1 Tax=Pleionea sediminis TaxID=2569479 RepID=UPI001184903B|nr:DUF1853 family protein [Pleionea sediminis]
MRDALLDDLIWCTATQELLELPSSFFKYFDESRFSSVIQELIAKQPEHCKQLLTYELQSLKTRRLGDRFEAFWKVAFLIHPHFEIVTTNYPIRIDGKTLGELDLVVRYVPKQSLHHIELTCKYYLAVPKFDSIDGKDRIESDNCYAHWMGPGQVDRLDKKLSRLQNHQLDLPYKEEVATVIDSAGWNNLVSHSVFKGKLFKPINKELPENIIKCISDDAVIGYWGTLEDWSRRNKELTHCRVLNKDEWFGLRPLQQKDVSFSRVFIEQPDYPRQMLYGTSLHDGHLGFVVESDWLDKAQKQISHQ